MASAPETITLPTAVLHGFLESAGAFMAESIEGITDTQAFGRRYADQSIRRLLGTAARLAQPAPEPAPTTLDGFLALVVNDCIEAR